VVSCSEAASGTVTRALVPLNSVATLNPTIGPLAVNHLGQLPGGHRTESEQRAVGSELEERRIGVEIEDVFHVVIPSVARNLLSRQIGRPPYL